VEVQREARNRETVRLKPDPSGKLLWAEYSLGVAALLADAEIRSAGTGFSNIRRSRALLRAA
jgi:hypothetical protein